MYLCAWWRWRDSNPWPPACRAGALPAELHPRFRSDVPFFYLFPILFPRCIENRTTTLRVMFTYSQVWSRPEQYSCSVLSWLFSFFSDFSYIFSMYFWNSQLCVFHVLLRKEVIQPHLPIRLPCYDLTPIIEPTFGCFLLAVGTQTSGIPDFHGLTGGVYKARERIHRGMLIRDY